MTLGRLCKCKSPTLYRFRGKHYTAREIAELTGMPLRTVRGRVRGNTVIDGPLPFGPTPKLYWFRGEQLTIRQIMDRTGIGRSQVTRRLQAGRYHAKGELVDVSPDPPINARLITYAGRTLTLTEWARELRIDRRTLRARISRGWPIADAFTRAVACKRRSALLRGEVPNFTHTKGDRRTEASETSRNHKMRDGHDHPRA